MNEEQLTSRVTLCPDGKYRWAYEVNLYRNPTILIDLVKVIVYIFLVMYVFFFIYGWIDGWNRIRSLQDLWESLWGMAVPFFWMTLFLVAIAVISYYIGARGSGGVYTAQFEMDEKGVLHAQMAKEVKKQQVVNEIAAMAGIAADEPGMVASSILSSTFTAWKSDFPRCATSSLSVGATSSRSTNCSPRTASSWTTLRITSSCSTTSCSVVRE